MEEVWEDNHRSLASRELSSPEQRSFYPEDPVFSSGNQFKKQMQPGLIGRIMPSWVKPILCKWRAFPSLMRGWRGDAHLGDAHLGPERKAYEPERWLMGVQAQALALISQFSSDRDSFWARGLYELVEL